MADKQYKKLEKVYEYDREKVTELAEAATEVIALEKRLGYLKSILDEHRKLSPFLWTTGDGKVVALHDIETDHLINILSLLANDPRRRMSDEMLAEARSRKLKIPGESLGIGSGVNW